MNHRDFTGHFIPMMHWLNGRVEALPDGCTSVRLDTHKNRVHVTWGPGGKYTESLPAPAGLPVIVVHAEDGREVARVKAGKRGRTVNFYRP